MAKSRDRLYVELHIGELDIDQAIFRLNLQTDPEFAEMMKQHATKLNQL